MLVLALLAVAVLRSAGAIDLLVAGLSPLLATLHLDAAYILPTLTKYIAGGTAMMGVVDDMLRQGLTTAESLNRAAGFLIHPFDVAGVAVLISAGPRVAAVWRPAALGAMLGIAVRSAGHLLWF
jgi:spore maturation protein SpmB